jgi:hypothetical protein
MMSCVNFNTVCSCSCSTFSCLHDPQNQGNVTAMKFMAGAHLTFRRLPEAIYVLENTAKHHTPPLNPDQTNTPYDNITHHACRLQVSCSKYATSN